MWAASGGAVVLGCRDQSEVEEDGERSENGELVEQEEEEIGYGGVG